MANFRAVVTLPNGNSALMSTQPQLILNAVQACAHIRSGIWSKAYHIELVDPALSPRR
jgi:hypothetical protein